MGKRNFGAIVLIIYALLELNDPLKEFTPEEIVCLFKKNKESPLIQYIIKEYKKHHINNKIKTLEDPKSLKSWLYKHTCIKSILWFQKSSNNIYKFKQDLIKKYKLDKEIDKLKKQINNIEI